MELITSYAEKRQHDKLMGQTSLFDMGTEKQSATDELNISESQEFDERQMLSLEAELLGIYVSGHPLFRFRDIMSKLTSMNLAQIQELPTMPKPEGFSRVPDEHDPTKRTMVIAGMISESKVILTKKGEKMAFVTIGNHPCNNHRSLGRIMFIRNATKTFRLRHGRKFLI